MPDERPDGFPFSPDDEDGPFSRSPFSEHDMSSLTPPQIMAAEFMAVLLLKQFFSELKHEAEQVELRVARGEMDDRVVQKVEEEMAEGKCDSCTRRDNCSLLARYSVIMEQRASEPDAADDQADEGASDVAQE